MVKAELSYNPYTLETDIRFNGQPPRINSLVEKYQSGILQDWIKDLPQIFHDEMNGYGFELEFSGTVRDFNELKRAFLQAGVSDEDVKLFHKRELEARDSKCERIKELLQWLEDNPNRNFNNEQFRKDNELLFDGAYSVVSILPSFFIKPLVDDLLTKLLVSIKPLNKSNLYMLSLILAIPTLSPALIGIPAPSIKSDVVVPLSVILYTLPLLLSHYYII